MIQQQSQIVGRLMVWLLAFQIGFNKTEYQREYMRSYRAKTKAEKEESQNGLMLKFEDGDGKVIVKMFGSDEICDIINQNHQILMQSQSLEPIILGLA